MIFSFSTYSHSNFWASGKLPFPFAAAMVGSCVLFLGVGIPAMTYAAPLGAPHPAPQVGTLRGGQQTGPPVGRRGGTQGVGGRQGNGGRQGAGGQQEADRGGSTFIPGGSRRGVEKKFEDIPPEEMDDPIFGAIGSSNSRRAIDPNGSGNKADPAANNRRRGKIDARKAFLEAEAKREEAERRKFKEKEEAEAEKRKRAGEILGKKKGKRRFNFVNKRERRMTEEEKEKMMERIEDAHSSFSVLFSFFGLTVCAVVLGVVGFVGKTIWDQRSAATEREQRQRRYQRKW